MNTYTLTTKLFLWIMMFQEGNICPWSCFCAKMFFLFLTNSVKYMAFRNITTRCFFYHTVTHWEKKSILDFDLFRKCNQRIKLYHVTLDMTKLLQIASIQRIAGKNVPAQNRYEDSIKLNIDVMSRHSLPRSPPS